MKNLNFECIISRLIIYFYDDIAENSVCNSWLSAVQLRKIGKKEGNPFAVELYLRMFLQGKAFAAKIVEKSKIWKWKHLQKRVSI